MPLAKLSALADPALAAEPGPLIGVTPVHQRTGGRELKLQVAAPRAPVRFNGPGCDFASPASAQQP